MGQKVAEQGSYSKFVTQFHGAKTQTMDTNVRLKPCTLICFIYRICRIVISKMLLYSFIE